MEGSDPAIPPAGDDHPSPGVRRRREALKTRPQKLALRSPESGDWPRRRPRRGKELLLRPCRRSLRQEKVGEEALARRQPAGSGQIQPAPAAGDGGNVLQDLHLPREIPRFRRRQPTQLLPRPWNGHRRARRRESLVAAGAPSPTRPAIFFLPAVPHVDVRVFAAGDDVPPVGGERRRNLAPGIPETCTERVPMISKNTPLPSI